MEISFIDIIDYLGTFAFATSGIRIATKRNFDLFGAYIVGLVTATGGGTLRDIMLRQSPFWMTQSSYLIITGLALIYFYFFHKSIAKITGTMFVFDTIGIGLFTVVGYQKTIDANFSQWVAIVMGMFTGAAGGVIRDILVNQVPLIFKREIYALPCALGGTVYAILQNLQVSPVICQISCASTVIALRFMAVKFHWRIRSLNLKKAPDNK